MQNVLLVVQLLLAVSLIAVILIQKSAQDGGGLMGGGATMGGLFTARGSANVITRTTAILATLFILNSLALGIIASNAHRALNGTANGTIEKTVEIPITPSDKGAADKNTGDKNIDNKNDGKAEEVPATPAGIDWGWLLFIKSKIKN